MKKINIYKLLTILLVFSFSSCVDEDTINQERPTAVGEARLDIVAMNADGELIPGASVTIFSNADDYAFETNGIITKETGADGVASFSPEELGGERGVYFFSISSGDLRNWASTVSTPYMYFSVGPTVITSTLGDVLPEFLEVLGEYQLSSYLYPGTGEVIGNGTYPACIEDDIYIFRKDGVVIRKDNSVVCAGGPGPGQDPVSVEGAVWSNWSLNAEGTHITIRDLDPDWDAVGSRALTITATQLVIDFTSGYVATLTRL